MTKIRPQSIPPLSFEALQKVQKIEEYLHSALVTACDPVAMSYNKEKVRRLLQTCVVEVLEAQLQFYETLPAFRREWVAVLAVTTIDSAVGLFPRFTPGEPFRPMLSRVVREHLSRRVLPPKTLDKQAPPVGRKTLREQYLAQFPQAKILDICWAGGQHYSEWKRWLRNAVKDGSAPDKAFRAILVSGKSPQEYRKQPRPNGWK